MVLAGLPAVFSRFILCRVTGSEEFLFIDQLLTALPGDLVAVERPGGIYVEAFHRQPFVGVLVHAGEFAKLAIHDQ